MLVSACTERKEPSGPLTLSAAYPQAGTQVAFTFNPDSTPLQDDSAFMCIVHYFTSSEYRVEDVPLEPSDDSTWKGSVTVPKDALTIALQFAAEGSNDKYGEAFMVYGEMKSPCRALTLP